jgi:hypothetical protein
MTDLATAIRDRLAAYLGTELAASFPALKVLAAWPDPEVPLPEYALAVLQTGAPTTEFYPPITYRVTPGVSPMGAVRYSYGWAEVSLQLDAWATHRARRDALADVVRDRLHRHPAHTLGIVGAWPTYQRQPGLVLKVTGLLDAPCDYRFDAAPLPAEAEPNAEAGEWRASWTGVARMHVVTEEQLALIKKLQFQLTLNGALDTTTITTP